MTALSIALCTFNGERYLPQQLASILAQSPLPQELVVSDDGSSDGSVDIVIRALEGSPVSLVLLRNATPLGVSANFEQAIRATSGDLVALCDQDDVWHPERLAAMVAAFESDDALELAFSDATLVDAAGAPFGDGLFHALSVSDSERSAIVGGDAFGALLRRNIVTGATVMFRRRLLARALPIGAEWVHDEWLAIIAAATSRPLLVDEQLIDYRQHGDNQIGVRRATLSHRIGRVLRPRGDRNSGLAARAEVLVERLASLGDSVDPRVLAAARGKAEAEAWRAALPDSRLRRIRPILRANRAGWYARFASQGRLDMLRDLLQPHSG
jgi:glycosyltransferase involved in cell wall biosynthesis